MSTLRAVTPDEAAAGRFLLSPAGRRVDSFLQASVRDEKGGWEGLWTRGRAQSLRSQVREQ